ncbi:MAG: NUDIX hydrolase [uncultured bacterium]|nr:MAG: NUDIX hydrolase [uncultured bacterium]
MNKELLEIYDLNDKLIGTQKRDEFYKEIKEEFAKTGKISRKVKSIRLFLLNSQGRIYLQKRSRLKPENPGLYDKTVGGHVSADDSFDMTVIRECAEELGIPAAIVPYEDFDKAIKSTDLSIIGIFRKIDLNQNFMSTRISINQIKFFKPYISSIYLGYYDGSIKFKDGESTGIEVFSLDELKDELKTNPQKFTEDVKFLLNKYENLLKPIK